MKQVEMFPDFDGRTYKRDRDGNRLNAQLQLVKRALLDGKWWLLAELAARVDAPEASISARIRDLRKPKFGGHTVERKYITDGLWAYRMVTQ